MFLSNPSQTYEERIFFKTVQKVLFFLLIPFTIEVLGVGESTLVYNNYLITFNLLDALLELMYWSSFIIPHLWKSF